MPGVLIKLKSLVASLPLAEQRVADYVSTQPEKVPMMSISQLARAAHVSVASVSRLSSRLGYSNFRQFKLDIAQSVMPASDIASIYQAITPHDSERDIVEKVFIGNIRSLQDTLKIIDRSALLKAARWIARANRVVFFGIGTSGHLALDAALRFTLLDIQAEAFCDVQNVFVQALRLKKGDIAVGISHSGRSKITVEALQLATGNGARTIGIANYLRSPLHKTCDAFLCTSFAESRVKVAALTSRIAQVCIIDTLYLLAAKHQKNLKKMELFNQYAEKTIRTSTKK